VINANRHTHQHLPTDVTNIAQLCQTQTRNKRNTNFTISTFKRFKD